MLAEKFLNEPGDVVRREQGGVGNRWWLVTIFRDGSVRSTTLGRLRVHASAAEALKEWKATSMPPGEEAASAGIVAALEREAGEWERECLSSPCRSPIACGAFGYCRERNLG